MNARPAPLPRFALNFSSQAAGLVAEGQLDIDLFKCPAWPDLIARAAALRPVYVHLSLHAGHGDGVVRDSHGAPADWDAVEALLEATETPFANIHLTPTTFQHPGIPRSSLALEHMEPLVAAMTKDVDAAVRRFGAGHVIVENDYDDGREQMVAATLPEAIAGVCAATGCGFLLDASHARLAARALRWDERDYLSALPLAAIREVHLTGLGFMGEPWVGRMAANGVAPEKVASFAGRMHDHLPLSDDDWAFAEWAARQMAAGAWGKPWVVALEYGGEGPIWQAITDGAVIADQAPRLRRLLQEAFAVAPPAEETT